MTQLGIAIALHVLYERHCKIYGPSRMAFTNAHRQAWFSSELCPWELWMDATKAIR